MRPGPSDIAELIVAMAGPGCIGDPSGIRNASVVHRYATWPRQRTYRFVHEIRTGQWNLCSRGRMDRLWVRRAGRTRALGTTVGSRRTEAADRQRVIVIATTPPGLKPQPTSMWSYVAVLPPSRSKLQIIWSGSRAGWPDSLVARYCFLTARPKRALLHLMSTYSSHLRLDLLDTWEHRR